MFMFVVIATWYLVQAVTLSKGPFNIFKWAREKLPHGGLLECHICLGIWIALLFTWISDLHAPVNLIVLNGVAAAGVFVILWDGSVFFKSAVEAWLYALQMAAQQPTTEVAEIKVQIATQATQMAVLQAKVEGLLNAQQHLAPLIAVLQENGCGSVEGSANPKRE